MRELYQILYTVLVLFATSFPYKIFPFYFHRVIVLRGMYKTTFRQSAKFTFPFCVSKKREKRRQ